jgi:uncharacterized membrane protein (UPF0127 family)
MKLKINDNIFKVKVLLDENSKRVGMMNRKFDNSFNGLVFFMNQPNNSFWMKNCIIPLDIIYITKNKINKIHHNCPPCETDNCPSYQGNGNIILEIKGGSCRNLNIKENDTVEYLF